MSERICDLSAAERNKRPVFAALKPWLTGARDVLEIGAGDATHARHALTQLPGVNWQISEVPGAHYRRLLTALADEPVPGLPIPIALDVSGTWPALAFDAMYGANVTHIMDWPAVTALFAGASAHLRANGLLCLYGPFLESGRTPKPGNAAFDAALRSRDPAMGLREIGALDAEAARHGMVRVADHAMPSDNRLLIWRLGKMD